VFATACTAGFYSVSLVAVFYVHVSHVFRSDFYCALFSIGSEMSAAVSFPRLDEAVSLSGVVVDLEHCSGEIIVGVELFAPLMVLGFVVRSVLVSLRGYKLVDVVMEVPDFLNLMIVFGKGGL